MHVNSIEQVKKLEGQTVLMRVDYNVPIVGGRIREDFKILQSLEDINFLLSKNCRVILASHLGQPDGKKKKEFSLKPVAVSLSKLLKRPVEFVNDCVGDKVKVKVKKMKPGSVLLLENLRFYKEEKTNNERFAKRLAALADIYVNNAFAVSHRADASVTAIKKFIPSYAGILLAREILNLAKVFSPKKPLVIVMGGSKIDTKAALVKKLYPIASQILIGGALANSFFAAKKWEIGKSLVDEASIKFARELLKKPGASRKIILPTEVVVSETIKKGKKESSIISVRKYNTVNPSECICDIGPEAVTIFSQYIKKAKTLVWNGPMGMFELANFRHGTLIMARLVASVSSGKAFGVVGGGETIEALNMSKMGQYVDWVSTGGGAMLSFLGAKKCRVYPKS